MTMNSSNCHQKETANSSSSSSSSKLVLYSYWQSSCSWRVRFALSLKALCYEYKAVDLTKGEQFSPEFEKLNPLHYVPVLVDGDVLVSDSYAILLHLEENYPQRALLPADPQQRALNLQVSSIINSSIQPLHMLSLLKYIEGKFGLEERRLWAQSNIEKGFLALEKLLKDFVSKHATGEDVYMADVFLAPQIAVVTSRFDIDMGNTMLPYLDLQEAEAALGRELTSAEKLWFNYSAKKHDYFLHFHNFIFLLLFYSLIPLPYMLTELSRSKKMNKYKIQPKVKRSFSDMLSCYKNVMQIFLLVACPLQIMAFSSIKMTGIRTSLPLPSKWEIFWQILVYFIIEDYFNYWIHRFLHTKWGYEKIHHVHHEHTAPFGYAAPYAHWAVIMILGIPSFLGPTFVPGHIITYWLWFIVRQIESIETHSGYEFSWSPSKYIPFYGGAEFHDYHHYVGRYSQSNFASVFTYCDYIYGTDKGYRYHKSLLHKSKNPTS